MNGHGSTSFQREPLWWIAAGQGIIQALFVLLSSFHVPIDPAQQAAITGLFIVLGTAFGRSKVYSPVDKQGNPVLVHTLDEFLNMQAMPAVVPPEPPPQAALVTPTREELAAKRKRNLEAYNDLLAQVREGAAK